MLKCLLLAFICALTYTCGHCYSAQEQHTATINWLTNYEEASAKAKENSLPLFIFFTGTKWCTWCNKLEEETFDTSEFAELVGKQFVFLKLDFPKKDPQDPNYVPQDSFLKQQNEQLRNKFNVRSFPTVIIYDQKQQKQIGVTGYLPGGPKQYATKVLKMVSDYQNYMQKMQKMGKLEQTEEAKISSLELRQLYEKARELGLDNDLHHIIKLGLNSDQKTYFQIEHYRLFADEGLIHAPEAVALRQQLLAVDPSNEQRTHYQIAVIDFEAYSEESERENASPDQAVGPLVAYIEKFGKQDKENLWRLNMIISQVYLDKNKLAQALKYAQSCYETAPPAVQSEIATAIKNIQAQAR